MKKMILAFLMVMGIVLAGVRLSAAQEVDNDKFSFGKVMSVAADQVTIKEYDFAKDADVEVAYTVTSATELGNVASVKDLVADDDVVIDYVEQDGKRVVTTLVREEKGAEVPAAGVEENMVVPVAEIPVAPVEEFPAE